MLSNISVKELTGIFTLSFLFCPIHSEGINRYLHSLFRLSPPPLPPPHCPPTLLARPISYSPCTSHLIYTLLNINRSRIPSFPYSPSYSPRLLRSLVLLSYPYPPTLPARPISYSPVCLKSSKHQQVTHSFPSCLSFFLSSLSPLHPLCLLPCLLISLLPPACWCGNAKM